MSNTPFTTLTAALKTQLETVSGVTVYDKMPTQGAFPDKSVLVTCIGRGFQPRPQNVHSQKCVPMRFQLDLLAKSDSTLKTLADNIHEAIYTWAAHPENEITDQGDKPWESGRTSSMHRRVFDVELWTWITK